MLHISLPIVLSPQMGAIVLVLLLILAALVGRIVGSRRRQRKRSQGRKRNPAWSKLAREHRLREPACVVCGHKGRGLQGHHIRPFHLHPELELDPDNLITLCEVRGRNHHLLIGHLDAWTSYNVHVRQDAKHFHRKTAVQIRKDPQWLKRVQQRP